MPLVHGQRNTPRSARRAGTDQQGTRKVQALPQLKETGELTECVREKRLLAKKSARSRRRSPRSPRSNPSAIGAAAGQFYANKRRVQPLADSDLEGLLLNAQEELLAPLGPIGGKARFRKNHTGSCQQKLPSVGKQDLQYGTMGATVSTATPAMTPQSALGYDLPTSRTTGDFYASTPRTGLSAVGYDTPTSRTSRDFYASSSSELADFHNATAGFGTWYNPQYEASDPDAYKFNPGKGQKALGLWSMAAPKLPPAPFARQIYNRKPKEGVRELHICHRIPMPDYSDTSTGHHSEGRAMNSMANYQSGGSSPSSARIRSTSEERAATREASNGFAEVQSARSRRPTLSSSSKLKHLVDEHQKGGSAEQVVILGDTKLKFRGTSVVAEREGSPLPKKRPQRKTMLPAYLNSKASSTSPTTPARTPSYNRSSTIVNLNYAAIDSDDDQGSPAHGKQPSSGTGGGGGKMPSVTRSDSGRSEQTGQEHASLSSPKDHEVKSHQDTFHSVKSSHQDTFHSVKSSHFIANAKTTTKEDKVADAFKKLQEHNEIHEDDLARALELCGFVQPNADWIKQISTSLTEYSTLDLEELRALVEGYTAMQHEAYFKAFEECDLDGTGFVEHFELEQLLCNFGIEPMTHVMDEVLAEVDEDGRGELDLKEFENLMDVIKTREGFTKSEYQEFLYLFKRFDRDGSGEIDVKELIAMIGWLGYSIANSDLQAIVAEVDVDGSGEINRREFLVCMRKLRDRTLNLMKRVIEENDEDGSGTIDRKELLSVLRGLGYEVADSTAIEEAQMDANLGTAKELRLSELWRILAVYRLREGMTNKEVKSIYHAFDLQDKDGSGELETLEAPGALRELGYKCEFAVVQNVLGKVDVDDTGTLDQVEFRKMVRMLQARDFECYREAFRECDTENKKVISKEIATEAVAALGFTAKAKPMFRRDEVVVMDGMRGEISVPQHMVNIDGFVSACDRHAKEVRQIFMRNGGWSDDEVEYYRQIFARYDVWEQGEISNKELVRLVEDTIPEMASDRAMRPQLLWLMRQCQVNDDLSSGVNFRGFLKLMSLFREIQDKERANKEQAAVKDTGFSQQEVAEFRELFLISDVNCMGELDFTEVRAMVHAVTPLGDALTTELQIMFDEATMRTGMADDTEQKADFPELLRLMKRLLDINFAGIKEKT